MYTIHGLVRAKNIELGVDEDTGGQIVYVLELAKTLSKQTEIDKIDIITRKIEDPQHPGYDKDIEEINKKINLVRLPCGPKKYIKKVDLWPYLDEFTQNAKNYIENSEQKPDIIQSNYADGGFVGRNLAKKLAIPLVHISHSLAKPEIERLKESRKNFEKIIKENHFKYQAELEQKIINDANAIVASSENEKTLQYGLYNLKSPDKIQVIYPGIDLDKIKILKTNDFTSLTKNIGKKPIILALTRMDVKKNLIGLVKAFLKDKELQKIAQLVIASSTFNAESLSSKEKNLITEIKEEINKSNISETVSLINPEDFGGPFNLYKIASESKGIFVNPALFEGFGLTTLEAGIFGLPVVATKNGGPSEVVNKCKNGILINPLDKKELAEAIKKIIKNEKLWQEFSENSVKNISKYYSWENAAKKQIELFFNLIK